MRTNPFWDALQFLIEAKWTTGVFWALLVTSAAIARRAFRREPAQRTLPHLWMFASRLIIGAMWWQQSLWKLPPTYTNRPDGTGGLRYWVGEMANHAAFSAQSRFVKDVVLQHFGFFAPQVYFAELAIALSLMLGLFTRLGGTLGALMALNLWLGLYRAPYEWPWTYFFLIVVNVTFLVFRAGRSLGLDALLAKRSDARARPGLLHRFWQLAS
jgi:uncharacterized membrane protein YphA (DoxX/SURF4 family)